MFGYLLALSTLEIRGYSRPAALTYMLAAVTSDSLKEGPAQLVSYILHCSNYSGNVLPLFHGYRYLSAAINGLSLARDVEHATCMLQHSLATVGRYRD